MLDLGVRNPSSYCIYIYMDVVDVASLSDAACTAAHGKCISHEIAQKRVNMGASGGICR
jgi:hypothetical protein